MGISARIVADSQNEFGNRLTTMVVTMPRMILAEFNTHRMFSRNSASSRAIPFEKMVKSVEDNPFIPIAWQKDHKGMQGVEYLNNEELKWNWLEARDNAVRISKSLSDKECTKQLCNRLLEPFMWHTVIVSATEWENFFALRCPQYYISNTITRDMLLFRSKKDALNKLPLLKDGMNLESAWRAANKGQAEIHMMALAETMWDAMNESEPEQLKEGEWHIPFKNDIWFDLKRMEGAGENVVDFADQKEKISTVMAARTSFTVVGQDQKPMTYQRMIELHDEMKNADPFHASPFEHCGQVNEYLGSGWSGNFRGFVQYRKMIEK